MEDSHKIGGSESGYAQGYNADPSALTTQLIWREIGSLKELILTRIAGVESGITIAHDDLVRVPTDVQKQVGALREFLEAKIEGVLQMLLEKLGGEHQLKEEKFKKVDQRFELVEQARVEQKKDTAVAVDKALKEAKDSVTQQNNNNLLAINKSEMAMTKQIDQQAQVISQINKSLDEKINDLKDRMIRVESITSGVGSLRSDLATLHTSSTKGEGKDEGKAVQRAIIISAVSIGIAVLMALITIYNNLK